MNTLTSLFSTDLPRPRNRGNATPMIVRPVKRERDFGVGYGSSSGYAATVRYVPDRATPRFRLG